MAHHGSELPDFLKRQAEELGLGATGHFPQGKFAPCDEGEIQLAVANDPRDQRVYVNFGKPVAFVGMTPDQAIELAELIQKHALAARGITT